MENNRLTEAQSLELITSAIRDSRSRLARNAGVPFLIWGYVTVIVSLLMAFAVRSFDNPQPWMWGWLAIPVAGYGGMTILSKKNKGARNYIDRIISAVWTVFGVAMVPALVMSVVYRTSILFVVVTLIGMGTAITGMVIRDRATAAAGFLAMVSAMIFPLRTWLFARFYTPTEMHAMRWNSTNMLIFAAIFFLLMVIPGHILNRKTNRTCSRN